MSNFPVLLTRSLNFWITTPCELVGYQMFRMIPRPQSTEYHEDGGSVFFETLVTTNQTTGCKNMVFLVIGCVIFLCYKSDEAGLRDVMGCHI